VPPDRLGQALNTIAEAVRTNTWQFPTIKDWEGCFDNLEDALPFAALMTAGQRYLWWASGDLAEGLLRRFGRTKEVKARIGAIFGCKARTVEYRTAAAVTFPPEQRYPDVPTELYREALSWPDPQEQLHAALDGGLNAYQLRVAREIGAGRSVGSPIWRRQRAELRWEEFDKETCYMLEFWEAGSARFVEEEMDVVVTISAVLRDNDEENETGREPRPALGVASSALAGRGHGDS
jgi:hypothetical protein